MNLDEFKMRFSKLRDKGFVKSLRRGSTGVGFTLETSLELSENNLALPDIENIEIKAHREGSHSPITLFTFNKKAWVMPPLDAIKKYGSRDANGRLGLYYTMSLTPNSAGLLLTISEQEISVQHTTGTIIATWQLSELVKRFTQKMPALLLVSAHTEERDGVEYFHYYRARLMSETSQDLLAELFKTGVLLLDLRLHDAETRARNHGTGFRIHEDNLVQLFKKIRDI